MQKLQREMQVCVRRGGAVWTYVRPVDRFIPARMVETVA